MIEESRKKAAFNPEAFLNGPGVMKRVAHFEKAETVYSQGQSCSSVLYISSGRVRLSATNEDGKENAIAILEAGDFLGEVCLSDAFSEHVAQAVAMEPTVAFVIHKKEVLRALRQEQGFGSYFISYLLRRNARMEADLIDQLLNSSEKRLARVLYLLARPNKDACAEIKAPIIAQETLAGLSGTTRSRVNLFMNKFRRLGFIDYGKDGLRVHHSIIEGVLHN
jgi:CRP-like cAMP-binding protein